MAKSPLKWVGGKYRLADKITGLFPPHTTYVEVFGGAGHVLFRKEPSTAEIYNDLNGDLVNFFMVVKNKEKCAALYDLLDGTPYSREVFNECLTGMRSNAVSDTYRAYCFTVVNAQCFCGMMETWGVTLGGKSMPQSFDGIKERLIPAAERLKSVQLECQDFRYIIRRYDRAETLFYLDPPYTWDSQRTSRKTYDHEMSNSDHFELVESLLNIKGKAILSGYDTPIYDRLIESGWRKINLGSLFASINKTSGHSKPRRTEWVWLNF